jgi:uncharacterized protein
MSEFEMPAHGAFCWNELASTDAEAAKKFYTELLGWQLKESQAAGMAYTEIVAGGRQAGGIYQMTAEQGNAPSHWMAYVAVDDVDESAGRVEGLGGKVVMPPADIPNVGRFCIISDPAGATLSLIKLSAPGA